MSGNPDANIIFGATSTEEFEDEMRVTVIATGFEHKEEAEQPKAASGAAAKSADDSDIDAIFSIFNR